MVFHASSVITLSTLLLVRLVTSEHMGHCWHSVWDICYAVMLLMWLQKKNLCGSCVWNL